MFLHKVLLLALLASPHWVKVKNKANVVDRYWVNSHGNVLGWYYLPKVDGSPFIAQCYDGAPVEFQVETDASAFVQRCPVW